MRSGRLRTIGAALAALGLLTAALAGCATRKGATAPPGAVTSSAPAPTRTTAATPTVKRKSNLLASALGGFGLVQKLFPRKAEPPKALPAVQVGSIKVVNKEDHFVLIDTLVYQAAEPGDTLVTLNGGRQTATLKVSPLRNPPFMIADILSGTPGPGDKVYRQSTGTN